MTFFILIGCIWGFLWLDGDPPDDKKNINNLYKKLKLKGDGDAK
jgi:hypothetical protein